YSNLGAGQEMMRVTLGKSRVREIRPPGSVRAKPNGIATRPRSRERRATHNAGALAASLRQVVATRDEAPQLTSSLVRPP
ncbi:hypothetical protein EFB14_32415, partial [Rhizobium fabae]